jgi:hypothetical protein
VFPTVAAEREPLRRPLFALVAKPENAPPSRGPFLWSRPAEAREAMRGSCVTCLARNLPMSGAGRIGRAVVARSRFPAESGAEGRGKAPRPFHVVGLCGVRDVQPQSAAEAAHELHEGPLFTN